MTKTTLTDLEQQTLRVRIDADGEHAVSKWLDVSRQTVARALAGLPMRREVVKRISAALTVPSAPEESTAAVSGT